MTLEILWMAFESLFANKIRTFLSVLGIIIGVSTVIAVFAIGQGAQKAVDDQFQNLSANSIIIMSMRARGATASSKLTASDAKAVLEKSSYVSQATAAVSGNATAAIGDISESFSVAGTDENYFAISNLEIKSGRLYTGEEAASRSMLAVLGSGAAATLFPDGNDPVGEYITLGGKRMEVIGVLAEEGSSMGGMSPDDSIYIPYVTATKSILGTNAMVRLMVNAKDVDSVEAATEDITLILRNEHKLKSTQEDDFRIMDAGSMVSAAQSSAALLTTLLTGVAAIVLLVSGIGIMNVMFVTVAERTKEIGIAKAIGGKQSDILLQFLLESIILSMTGGLIGVGIGQAAIPIIVYFNWISVAASVTGPILGFSFSALVGVFFGFYPAFKASRLDPVDALRSE